MNSGTPTHPAADLSDAHVDPGCSAFGHLLDELALFGALPGEIGVSDRRFVRLINLVEQT